MRDFLTGLVIGGLGLFSWFYLIPYGVQQYAEAPSLALSATFWPYVITALLIGLGGCLMVQGGVRLRLQPSTSSVVPKSKLPKEVLWAVFFLVPYYLLAQSLGLLLASVIAFAAYALLAGEKSYKKVALLSFVVPAFITLFFIYIAQVLVPLGPIDGLFS